MMALGRVLPALDGENAHFWQSGRAGRLQILRCGNCGLWIHPPSPICRRCHGKRIAPDVVSGRGTVVAYTINYHQWQPDIEVPFTIATIELAEQAHLRVTSQIVGCRPEEVHSGMPVEVRFVHIEDVWLPLFAPIPAADGIVASSPSSQQRRLDR